MPRILLLTLLLTFVALIRPLPARAAPLCQFTLGFAGFQDANSTLVGDCLSDEAHAANGDSIQYTTNGYLVWTKATNVVVFVPKAHGDPFADRFSRSNGGSGALSPPERVSRCGDTSRHCHAQLP